MARTLRRTVGVLLLAALCTACKVDVTVDVQFAQDGSGTITVVAAADPAVLAVAPNLATDLRFDDVAAAGWTVDGPSPTPGGGLRVQLTHAFATPAEATAILAGLNGPSGPLLGVALARERVDQTTTYTLTGTLQVAGGLDAFSDADLLAAVGGTPYATQVAGSGLTPADAVSITFSARLPGNLQSSTAPTGEGLRWVVPLDGTALDLTTVSKQVDKQNKWAGPVSTGALIALVAWGVIAVGFIAYVIIARRRRAASGW